VVALRAELGNGAVPPKVVELLSRAKPWQHKGFSLRELYRRSLPRRGAKAAETARWLREIVVDEWWLGTYDEKVWTAPEGINEARQRIVSNPTDIKS